MMKKSVPIIAAAVLAAFCGCATDGKAARDSSDAAPETDGVSIANPFTDCATLEEAEGVAGFDIEVPDTLFVKYDRLVFRAIKDNMIEIIYRNGENTDEIRIRKAKGGDDISGDYTEYPRVETVPAADVMLTLKGEGETVHVATWLRGEYSFSITSDEAIDRYVAAKLIQMIH